MTPRMQRPTILVVDDEPAGREVLYGLLTIDSYDVETVSDGAEALQKAAAIIPDLILLDVMMPGIDGFEVCRQLRKNPALAEVPVIMLTALDDRDSLLEGIEAGADDFISKPFDRQELRTRVRTITRLNRFRRLVTERNKFQWVIDHADDGYLVINNTGEIEYTNGQARHYLNLPTDTPITQRFQDVVKRHFRREPKAAWETKHFLSPNAKKAAEPRYLVRPETSTAHTFWLQVDILSTNNVPSAHPTDWIIRLRDVTAKMLLQRDMWQFQAMIAHKLRAPMVPVIGTIELLANEIDSLSAKDIASLAQRAAASVSRLRETVENIVRYADLTQQIPLSQMNDFPVAEFESLFIELGQAIGIETISVAVTKAAAATRIALPPEALNTIVQEILNNAQKFHPKHTPGITVDITADTRNKVRLKIADDGIALSPEQLAHI